MTNPNHLTHHNLTLNQLQAHFDDIVYDNTRQDDVIYDDYWIYVCPQHVKQYAHIGKLNHAAFDTCCGVHGCLNRAVNYINVFVKYPIESIFSKGKVQEI